MDELDRDLANGLLGEQQINDSLSGDLTGAYRNMAAREAISDQDAPGRNYRGQMYRERQPQLNRGIRGPVVPRPTLAAVLAGVLLVLVLLIVAGVH